MKAVQIVVVVVVATFVLAWVTRDHGVGHIARALPGCGGQKPMIFELGGIALLGLLCYGLSNLYSRPAKEEDASNSDDDAEEVDSEPEPREEPEGEENDGAEEEP